MRDIIFYLLSGILFGFSAGISPGPLLTLVISETLRHNLKEGIKIAFAPILTDLPIILVTIFVISKLANFYKIIGGISIFGGIYLFYLAYECFITKQIDMNVNPVKPNSIKKGIIANFLNPSPYLFWFTIGAPTTIKAYNINVTASILFIASFYVFIIGTKVVVALIVEKSRTFLKSNYYIYIMKFLGFVLALYGLIFLKDGIMSVFF